MKKRIIPIGVKMSDLPAPYGEIIERHQILLDESTDEHKRSADNAAECIHQMNRTMGLCAEAHIAVEEAKAGLKGYVTQRQLYLTLGIVALIFFFVGYNVHG